MWNLSCPAVSQICSFTRFPSKSIVLILKSIPTKKGGGNGSIKPGGCRLHTTIALDIPIVEMKVVLNVSSE